MKRIAAVILTLVVGTAYGQTITTFSARDVVSGASFTLSDEANSRGVVIIFTSNTCPFDAYYFDRFDKLVADYNGRIPVVFVNPHPGEDESADAMKALAQRRGLKVPYLEDKNQAIMRALKVTRTPEAIVLKPENGAYKVFYRGSIDDNAQVATDVHRHYLADAIEALLAGRNVSQPVVRPMGCNVRQI
ncbi:MAG: redoxin domain-containing protein [Cyclobacteriaceae bacterium]|jgi:thiol-disulfide isomerase/thioredoxin|nr:redoxin domain-containing protein [Cyclobacteriaceae bacterium]